MYMHSSAHTCSQMRKMCSRTCVVYCSRSASTTSRWTPRADEQGQLPQYTKPFTQWASNALHYSRPELLADMKLTLYRPDQLLQPDDPLFHPSMAGVDELALLDVDLSESSPRSENIHSSLSGSLRMSDHSLPNIEIPSSAGSGDDGFGSALHSSSLNQYVEPRRS